MSAVPATQVRTRVRTRTRPQLRVVSRPKVNVGQAILVRTFAFAAIVAFTFLGSSLFGQVMAEKARRDGIRATERARAAVAGLAPLKAQLYERTNAQNVRLWAAQRGLVAPDQLAVPSSSGRGLIASNR